MNLNGKTAVVTGAGSGIGREVAKLLSQKGCVLAISDINEKTVAETAQLINKAGGQAHHFVVDVSKPEQVKQFKEDVEKRLKQVDILVNNAGAALGPYTFEQTTQEEWDWIMGVNFWSVLYHTRAFLPMLKTRPEAAIVNLSSLFGLMGVSKQVPYCTTKFAVRGFTMALRMELMRSGSNITVTNVHPGGVKTNIIRDSRTYDEKEKAGLIELFEKKMAKTSPEEAAQIIVKGIEKKKLRILVGKDAKRGDRIVRWFPEKHVGWLNKRAMRRPPSKGDGKKKTSK